jgi:hypothetical protein
MMPTPDPRAIRELAYRLWEERGRPDESADALWLEAERQLTSVHGQFTRSEAPTPNVTGEARAQSVSAAGSASAAEVEQAVEYSADHPPVNAEFKWAAAELQKSTSASAGGQSAPGRRNTRR